MDTEQHPFYVLRKHISRHVEEYRYPTDTSRSLFNPQHGFAKAYSIPGVESALDVYEQGLRSIQAPQQVEKAVQQARAILFKPGESESAKDFAASMLSLLQPHVRPTLYQKGLSTIRVIDWDS